MFGISRQQGGQLQGVLNLVAQNPVAFVVPPVPVKVTNARCRMQQVGMHTTCWTCTPCPAENLETLRRKVTPSSQDERTIREKMSEQSVKKSWLSNQAHRL